MCTEKEEGLVTYSPLLSLSPTQSLVKTHRTHVLTHTAQSAVSLAVAPTERESRCVVLGVAREGAVWASEVSASQDFDTLSQDFAHGALLALIALLAGCVVVLRQWTATSALKRLWL